MTADIKPSPEDLKRNYITGMQIAAACDMRFDPWNWKLTPLQGTTRTLYRRVKPKGSPRED
jgi:hypothetical protein